MKRGMVISPTRLMEASESCIENVHRHGLPAQRQIVATLFNDAMTYRRWEVEHYRLMRSVAEDPRFHSERRRLRTTCFALTHSKALFEYLRSNRVTGEDRVAVFRAVYGTVDYARAVVAEHGRFLRATWSRLCADHIGATLLHDAVFIASLQDYETAYLDYVSLYCGNVIAESRGADYAPATLVGYTKISAATMRAELLALNPKATERPPTPAKPGASNPDLSETVRMLRPGLAKRTRSVARVSVASAEFPLPPAPVRGRVLVA